MDPVLVEALINHVNATKITRQSKSNLALAFVSLGRERKRDITVFYAFCRVIDDIADSTDLDVVEKRMALSKWRQVIRVPTLDEPPLACDVRKLIGKYSLSIHMLEEIISGVEMDLDISRYRQRFTIRTDLPPTRGPRAFQLFRYRAARSTI